MEDAPERTNELATGTTIDTPVTRGRSLDVLRRNLIALRVKHGADTPIGHRISNIIELLQAADPPVALIERQMVSLDRLLHAR